jgi:competence protein ComEA
MAMEDFEWHGDVELTEPSRARQVEPRATGSSWLTRATRSVWLQPALRLGGMALLLSVLAGIGVVATTYARPGFDLPGGARGAALALGTSWLKPAPNTPPGGPGGTTTTSVETAHALAGAPTESGAAPVASASPAPTGPPNPDNEPGITSDGKVVLNRASAEELTKLPGVGMKRAQAIVALRTKLKRFKQPSDLLRVKGIGPRGLQRMLPHLVLD